MKREGFLRAALVGVAALCGLGVAKKAAVLSDPTPHVRNVMPMEVMHYTPTGEFFVGHSRGVGCSMCKDNVDAWYARHPEMTYATDVDGVRIYKRAVLGV